MEILEDIGSAYAFVAERRRRELTIGLVPTMGALHAGHFSLVDASNECCDFTIATIFVNPTQFAAGEDLDKYPRTLDEDLSGLRERGVAAVFVPTADEMFPQEATTFVQPPAVGMPLEGEFRPTHFRGVATVVLKLFQILPATHAFFGQKDYQQLQVISAMVRDLNVPIEVVGCEIVRESDGLAMSSRNRYLTTEERQRALRLSKALAVADKAVKSGQRDVAVIEGILNETLRGDAEHPGVDSIDYAAVVDGTTLAPIGRIQRQAVALIAARVGSTRLIDNVIWSDL